MYNTSESKHNFRITRLRFEQITDSENFFWLHLHLKVKAI